MGNFRIGSIEVENLRGYEYTLLELSELKILVGENNEGKSSLLKMFEKLLSIKREFWLGKRLLADADYSFWHPANDSRHQARRLTINLVVGDGRFGRKFAAKVGQTVPIRFAIKSSSGECRLNVGPPRRGEVHDARAVDLLEQIKRETRLFLLPPVRDATSSEFTKKLTRAVREKVREKLQHSQQAGAPKEYRLAKEVVAKINKIVSLNTAELTGAADSPLAAMIRASEVRVDLFPSDISNLIEDLLYVYISTGAHDSSKVQPAETGNGLQSLIDIDLSLNEISKGRGQKQTIVIIEEPEAFLHPSAQRQFMSYLRKVLMKKIDSAIITTHSTIIVDESRYDEIVLVRNQRHYQAARVEDVRAQINTSLMSASNSEMFFARTVVLVEGEGDRATLNTLLRRIKAECGALPELTGIVVQPTGGCNFYAPWLRLIDSFAIGSLRPFECLWLMDGDTASISGTERPILRALTDSQRILDVVSRQRITDFGDLAWGAALRDPNSTSAANAVLRPHGGIICSCDLEWAFFNGASSKAIRAIKEAMSECGVSNTGSVTELARRLGSKIETGDAINRPKKSPHIRGAIAAKLPLNALPPEIYSMLHRILSMAIPSSTRLARALQESALASS